MKSFRVYLPGGRILTAAGEKALALQVGLDGPASRVCWATCAARRAVVPYHCDLQKEICS